MTMMDIETLKEVLDYVEKRTRAAEWVVEAGHRGDFPNVASSYTERVAAFTDIAQYLEDSIAHQS